MSEQNDKPVEIPCGIRDAQRGKTCEPFDDPRSHDFRGWVEFDEGARWHDSLYALRHHCILACYEVCTMTSDILSRLAAAERDSVQTAAGSDIFGAARREIERLLAENADLFDERDWLRSILSRIANQSARDYDDPEREAYASRQIARQALGEDAKPMPDGARRSQCPACGWTFGTHAPDCEARNV